MRLVLTWLDQLRTTTVRQLPAYCAALVSQLEALVATINTWAATDHTDDGKHGVVRFTEKTAPSATTGAMSVYWDGTNLKYVKPDGTTGNIV